MCVCARTRGQLPKTPRRSHLSRAWSPHLPQVSPALPGLTVQKEMCMKVNGAQETRVDFIRPNAGDRTLLRTWVSFCVARLKASAAKPHDLRGAPDRDLLLPEVPNAVPTAGRPFQTLEALPAHPSECCDCCGLNDNGVAACWSIREAMSATPSSGQVGVAGVTSVS